MSNGVTGYAVIMNKLEELLNKVPQSVKDKFLIKKRERAIEIVKQKLTDSKKNISDFSDDEMEGLIGDEEKKLKDDQLIAILVGVAAAEGISLIIGWVVYIRATLRSLGLIGLILAALFFSAIMWLLIDWGWLGLNNVTAMSWVILVLISAVLAVGVSWSHFRRKISGQVDSDDVDEE